MKNTERTIGGLERPYWVRSIATNAKFNHISCLKYVYDWPVEYETTTSK